MAKQCYIAFSERNYRKSAKQMVLDMIRFSNHSHSKEGLSTDSAVKKRLAAIGADFNEIVELVRDYEKRVPLFENYAGYTVNIIGTPIVTAINSELGEVAEIKGPGAITNLPYASMFEDTIKIRNEAMRSFDVNSMNMAIVSGLSCIDGYIGYKVAIWNNIHPDDQLVDSKEAKVSFNDKIDKWIPKMTQGSKFNKGTIVWPSNKVLRGIRDDYVHPKEVGMGISADTFRKRIDLFRDGIALFLLDLHKLFKEMNIPSIIIRAAYAPDARVIINPSEA